MPDAANSKAMRTRMQRTAADRRAEIPQAAVQAFVANGYAAATTAEIARLAGVSQPYVIRLFGTKQQLFLAILRPPAPSRPSARSSVTASAVSTGGSATSPASPPQASQILRTAVLLAGMTAAGPQSLVMQPLAGPNSPAAGSCVP
jgi:hypothetical protein